MSRETKFSGASWYREIIMFPVYLALATIAGWFIFYSAEVLTTYAYILYTIASACTPG